MVELGCNIHDWMVAYVMVLETPYFGVTDATGATVLRGLLVDSYDVRVWHSGLLESKTPAPRTATLAQADFFNVDFTI